MNFSNDYYEKIEQYKRAHTEGMYTRGSRDPADKIPRRVVAPHITMQGTGIMRNASYFANTTVVTRMLGGERFINSVLDYGSGKPIPIVFAPGKAGDIDPSRAASENKKTRDDKDVQDFLYPQNQQDFIEYIGVDKQNFYQWDPAISGIDDPLPPGAQWDQVWCIDVLEHIPEQDLDAVLDDLFSRARISLVLMISGSPGKQMFRDDDYEFDYKGLKEEGEDLYNIQHVADSDRQLLKAGNDLHCTVRDPQWWIKKTVAARKRNWANADGKFLRCSIKTGPDEKGKTTLRETRWFGPNPKGLTPENMPIIKRQSDWWEDFDRILIEKKVFEMARFPRYQYEKWPKKPSNKGHANMIYWKKTDMKEHLEGKEKQHKPGEWEMSRTDKPMNRKTNLDGTRR